MSATMINDRRSALLAQCQPASRMPEAEAAALPIHVVRLGARPKVVVVHGDVQGGLGGGPVTRSSRPKRFSTARKRGRV